MPEAPPPPGPEAERVQVAVAHLRALVGEKFAPTAGVVLGSGLGSALRGLKVRRAVPYAEIPGFLPSSVEGHAGRLLFGRLAGVDLVVMQGRVHLYEGHAPTDVVLPIRVLIGLGARTLVVTNAAGGANPSLLAGDLMLIKDHLNLTGKNPLVGKNEATFGPRFPDMSEAYDLGLRRLAHEVAGTQGFSLREGVYAGLLGPSYETPAEVRMLHGLGADAVGMSTVLEVIAARHLGAKVLGISCISNQGAGISASPLSHAEVQAAARGIEARLLALVTGVLAKSAAPTG
ncbi:MAG: purine-nucleoside phosphorylase [Myxococcota bacterium]